MRNGPASGRNRVFHADARGTGSPDVQLDTYSTKAMTEGIKTRKRKTEAKDSSMHPADSVTPEPPCGYPPPAARLACRASSPLDPARFFNRGYLLLVYLLPTRENG